MAKVAIWMGHSGAELGAQGIVLEDDVTRQARTWAVAYARACGHTVTTDNDNMSLTQRINASTSDHAGILEWHANLLGTGQAHGTEVWYSQYDSGRGEKIANAMADVGPKYGFADRGAKDSSTNRYGRLGILDTPAPTAVLVELFFLDNQSDVNHWKANGKAFVEDMTRVFLAGLGLQSTPSNSQPSAEVPNQTIKDQGGVATMYALYFVNNKAYFYNGVTFGYVNNPDGLKIIRQVYRDNNGKDIPEYHWKDGARFDLRLTQPILDADKIKEKFGLKNEWD